MHIPDPTAELLARRAQPAPRLLCAEDEYAHRDLVTQAVPIAEWAFRLHPPVFVDRPAPDLSRRGKVDAKAKTQARVEGGKWIADCPFCPSAQVVSPLDPRFLCAGADGCANGQVGGAFATVAFPRAEMCAEIEAVLLARPDRNVRAWYPHETVADLEAQNDEHLGADWRDG